MLSAACCDEMRQCAREEALLCDRVMAYIVMAYVVMAYIVTTSVPILTPVKLRKCHFFEKSTKRCGIVFFEVRAPNDMLYA